VKIVTLSLNPELVGGYRIPHPLLGKDDFLEYPFCWEGDNTDRRGIHRNPKPWSGVKRPLSTVATV